MKTPDGKEITQFTNSYQAPSIINILINLPLKMGSPGGPNVYPPFTYSAGDAVKK